MNGFGALNVSWIRFDGLSATAHLTVTEAADASSVTLTDTTVSSPDQFRVDAPCTKASVTTAVCPTNLNGMPVIYVSAKNEGPSDFTLDVPTLAVTVATADGNDTVRILHNAVRPNTFALTDISLGAGNDTFTGGPGPETVNGDQGIDTVNVFNSPAAADTVKCSTPSVEGPVDTVIVDSADTVTNNTNCMVRLGP